MSAQSQARLPISPRRPLISRTAAALRRPWPVGIPGAGSVTPAQLREAETLLKQGPGRTARDWQDLTKISLRKRPPRCLWRNGPESLATHLLTAGGAGGPPSKKPTYLCDNRTMAAMGSGTDNIPPSGRWPGTETVSQILKDASLERSQVGTERISPLCSCNPIRALSLY